MNTPLYVFSKKKMAENVMQIKQRLPLCDIHYALKANSEINVLSALKEIGLKFDVASTGEFLKLRKIDVPPEHIICTLPVKPDDMIETLYQDGCRYFVFDHIKELIKLDKLAGEAKKILRIYNADFISESIPYGMTSDELLDIKTNYPQMFEKIDGITFFLRNPNEGKSDDNLENMLLHMKRCEWFLDQLAGKEEFIFNIGGNYRIDKTMDDRYYERLNLELEKLKNKYGFKLMVEPGRAIIHTAGKLITKVIMTKERADYTEVFIDAGDPTGLFMRPRQIEKWGEEAEKSKKRKIYQFIATTCSHRILFTYASKFEINPGDLLCLSDYGAYSICYSSNFHAWERAKAQIVD